MTDSILVIPGDGIGQEVIPAAVEVLETVNDFDFITADAGDHVLAETGNALPDETYELATDADVTLFGAAGETAADVILPLREAVGSYANVRPVRAYPGLDALQPATDLVFIRENTEGVYSGIEADLADGVTTLTRVITAEASRRIAEFGFDYATENEYSRITVAHKANVMRTTDGQFLDAVREVAADHGINPSAPDRDTAETLATDIEYDEVLMDALAMHLLLHPDDYGLIICPNLAGDVLSDLAAGLVGGLGLLPSANIGPENALFEPVHGSAPDIAGDEIANPTAAILSAAMLLDHLGYTDAARAVRSAVVDVLADGPHTPDLGGQASTTDMTAAILESL